jgi:hypothetical protein
MRDGCWLNLQRFSHQLLLHFLLLVLLPYASRIANNIEIVVSTIIDRLLAELELLLLLLPSSCFLKLDNKSAWQQIVMHPPS